MNNPTSAVIFCDEGEELKVLLTIKEHSSLIEKFVFPQFDASHVIKNVNHQRIDCLATQNPYAVFYLNDVVNADLFDNCSWYNLKAVQKLDPKSEIILTEAIAYFWPLFLEQPIIKAKLPEFLLRERIKNNLKNESMETVFFGGTFNPLHEGHLECLRLSPNQNIIIIPDKNPWKKESEQQKTEVGGVWQNYLLLNEQFKNSSYSLFPGFIGKEGPNPTINWLKLVSCLRKALLIGDDNFMNFELWTDYKEVLNLLSSLYVVPRLERVINLQKHREILLKINPKLNIEILQEHSYQTFSSSALRNKL